MSEELELAYYLKEEYCSWFKQAKENGAEKIKETKDGLRGWDKTQLMNKNGVQLILPLDSIFIIILLSHF